MLEVTAGGLRVRAERTLLVAVTGAPAPVTVDGRAAPFDAPLTLRPGAVLGLGNPPVGLRSYLAVRGGIDVPPVLGSRSTDTLSGLGPAPLAAGDRLPVGDARGGRAGRRRRRRCARRRPGRCCGCCPGPRRDWLAPARLDGADRAGRGRSAPTATGWGCGWPGPGWTGHARTSCPARGWCPGAVQVPPDGAPVLFLADHPVTGGYPVLAVVTTDDLPAAAQLRPGDRLRFRPAR